MPPCLGHLRWPKVWLRERSSPTPRFFDGGVPLGPSARRSHPQQHDRRTLVFKRLRKQTIRDASATRRLQSLYEAYKVDCLGKELETVSTKTFLRHLELFMLAKHKVFLVKESNSHGIGIAGLKLTEPALAM